MKHESASISFADYREMLKIAPARLPKSVKVVLLADRGFVHTELMTMLTLELGWHYRIRIKSNTWLWRGNWCQPQDFHLSLGEAICLHNVRIHKADATPRRTPLNLPTPLSSPHPLQLPPTGGNYIFSLLEERGRERWEILLYPSL